MTSTPVPRELRETEKLLREICRRDPVCAQILAEVRKKHRTDRRQRSSPTAGLPRLAEADRPDPAELAQARKQVASARRLRGPSHPDRPVCP